MYYSVKELSKLLNGEIEGNPELTITAPAKIEEAINSEISFFANPKYEPFVYSTNAGAILVDSQFTPRKKVKATLIKVQNVQKAFGEILHLFDNKDVERIIANTVIKGKGSEVGSECAIGHYTVIGDKTFIGNNAIIDSSVYIANNVKIGQSVRIHSGARILEGTIIGDRCTIHANAVIGSDGFGYAITEGGKFDKIPQTGNVMIGNDVEIGANTVIDRASIGSTFIGNGVKLDNLIQIAHNVKIGENTAIAAQAGIAGSSEIGRNCQIGGQAGVVGHIKIAANTMIQAQSGVASSITEVGKKWYGSPAIPYTQYLRSFTVFRQLSELKREVYKLNQKS